MSKVFSVLEKIWDVILIVGIVGLILMRLAPIPFGYQPVVVLSNSMAPTFHQGALVYIDTNYDTGDMEVGDIIAYELNNGTQVTHRVHEITKEGIITKGDANESVDIAPISSDQVIGENVLQIEYIGNLFREFPNTLLIGVLVFAFAVKLFLSFVSWLFSKNEGEDDEKENENIADSSNTSSSN